MPDTSRQDYLSIIQRQLKELSVATPNALRYIGELEKLRDKNKMHSDVLRFFSYLLREVAEARDKVVLAEMQKAIEGLLTELPGRWNKKTSQFNPPPQATPDTRPPGDR